MSAGDDDRWGCCVTANVLTPKEQTLERFLGSECVFVTLKPYFRFAGVTGLMGFYLFSPFPY